MKINFINRLVACFENIYFKLNTSTLLNTDVILQVTDRKLCDTFFIFLGTVMISVD